MGVDVDLARQAMALRYPDEDPGVWAIPPERYIDAHLARRDCGGTHDERLVELYDALIAAQPSPPAFGDPDVTAVTAAMWGLGVLGTHDAKVHALAAVRTMRSFHDTPPPGSPSGEVR